ncbi:MFS transporter [Kineosporia succinea]|uniref:MFS family permease n=1 Tax=Kineosporia succinea TaxID=84632 RepID=A0ABT9PFK7_9ACTN|nr:MFS transporter [Kineosporia succinea]MDP9831271.1 MFS family permease [Kineosporia succinea]
MTTTTTKEPLPQSYRLWVSGAVISILGNGVLYFALGWTATGHSGALAGLVLTAVNVPRALFLLVGGVLGDRVGARRVMITGDAVMIGVCLLFALVLHLSGPAVWVLLATGLVLGVVDAFYLPASGSMPRLLVPPEQLPRALGLRQAGAQVAGLVAGPLGGLLVVTVGLAGVLLLDALTFAVVLAVLLVIRPLSSASGAGPGGVHGGMGGGIAAAALDGLRIGLADPVLRTVLLLTGAFGGLLLPAFSILVPLLAREHDWDARAAGLVIGAQALGTIVVALVVARQGAHRRAGLAVAGATVTAALGLAVMAASGSTGPAVAGAAVCGVGSGLFAGHASPTILSATPSTHLSRVQAMLVLVQTVTLLVTNNVVGGLADTVGATTMTVLCAALLLGSGLLALSSKTFRAV